MALLEQLATELREMTLISTLVRLLLAALFSGMIGMERGRRRRAAGMRTYMLVCIGATLAMLTNQYTMSVYGGGDPTRLGAQVISGVGFLGVGTIIVDPQQRVRGLTTAAGLWACACMGLALGVGFYSGAIITCVFVLSTITIINRFEQSIINRTRNMEIYVEFVHEDEVKRFLNFMVENSIKVRHFEITRPHGLKDEEDPRTAAIISLRLPKRQLHSQALENLDCLSGIIRIEEIQ